MNPSPRPRSGARRLVPLLFVPVIALALAGTACGTTVPDAAPIGTVLPATAPADPTGPTDPTDPTDPGRRVVARAVAPIIEVRATPEAGSPVLTSLGRKTSLGSHTTLLVVDGTPAGAPGDWVEVSLPTRPNGSTGWVRAADVDLRVNALAITVDRHAHRLVVTRDGDPVVETTVAIGAAATPTPTGSFYVTDLIRTDEPGGAYGPFALGLSGHSETLTEFAGGDGQLGIHGTDDPSSIGRSVSHGCVRVPNDVITQLSELIPLGTPVTVI